MMPRLRDKKYQNIKVYYFVVLNVLKFRYHANIFFVGKAYIIQITPNDLIKKLNFVIFSILLCISNIKINKPTIYLLLIRM